MAKRILFACELGNCIRQSEQMLPVAAGLIAAGHDVCVAVPPDVAAAPILRAAGLTVLDAPAWRAEPPPGFLASTYADVLLVTGYATQDALWGLLRGWASVLTTATPDMVFAGLAPTAMLACRIAGVPVATIGDGYALPPPTEPLPSMRPWAEVPADYFLSAEGRVLPVINACLRAEGAEPLLSLADLFTTEVSYLCAFPELDHYEGRGDADYCGQVFAPSSGTGFEWPPGAAERVFVAMDGRHRPFLALLGALASLGLPTVVQAAGISAEQAAALRRPSLHVFTATLDRSAVLAGCDIVACQDIGMVAPALLASRPVLLLPDPIEQMMILHRLARQGLGHGIPPDADRDGAGAVVRRLLDDTATRRRVANFARSYHGYTPALAIDAIVEDALALPALAGG